MSTRPRSAAENRRAGLQISVGVRNFADTAPADWRHILDQARAAEDAGVDRVFVADHLVFGRDLSAYGEPARGGVAGGAQPTGPDGEWLEPLTALTAMAAVTTRVRLATNVLIAPLRRAVVLAKVASTLDVLSHGRFELGVGIGWQEAEYRAAGVDFRRRGRVLDETLAVCRELWTSGEVTFSTEQFALDDVHMMPKPTDPNGVPIWVGGRAIPATARRLARFGVGWIPWGVTRENIEDVLLTMSKLVEAEGRDFSTLQVAYGLPTVRSSNGGLDFAAMFEPVPMLIDSGVTDFRTMVRLPVGYAQARRALEELVGHYAEAITS